MKNEAVMLISGTSKGIGRYLAEYYANTGMQVLGCSRMESDLEHDNYCHYGIDISDFSGVKEMFKIIRKRYGRLDYLVNNAGVFSKNLIMLTDEEAFKRSVDINIYGGVNITKNAVRLMQKSRHGRIVNISSISVPLADMGSASYSASKAFLEQFNRVLSKEVNELGITVNTVGLSWVEGSGMIKESSSDVIEETLNKTIQKSMITMEDISNAISFFISEESKAITGQTLYVGGL